MDQNPAKGKMPASASEQMRNVLWVVGMYFRNPPISRMSNVWWHACDTEPAPRKSAALKKAWVNRWKIAAVHAPTPSAMTMKPSWLTVE